jgi:phage shock protein C
MFEYLKNKKLYRSPKDALAFGVAAGIASYLEIDVVFARLAMIVVAIFSGWWPMIVLYACAVVLMPIDPAQDTVAPTQEPRDVTPVDHMDNAQNM